MRISDWSSDVCSSDLPAFLLAQHRDDLLLAEPGLPHVRLLTKADSSSNWQSFRGARQLRLWGGWLSRPLDRLRERWPRWKHRAETSHALGLPSIHSGGLRVGLNG